MKISKRTWLQAVLFGTLIGAGNFLLHDVMGIESKFALSLLGGTFGVLAYWLIIKMIPRT